MNQVGSKLSGENGELPAGGFGVQSKPGGRPLAPAPPPDIGVASLLDEAWRLKPFVPPFAFSAFFSPEDTLLCVCAADSALDLLGQSDGEVRFTELTSGSGLVGFSLLAREPRARLLGLDIDGEAERVATQNAGVLGVRERARFARADLWSASTLQVLEQEKPDLLVCNPPYVPEPPGTQMQVEAGAGPHGTAHLLRTLELARAIRPLALALSWCSLSDPVGIVAAANDSGYELHTLYVNAIADGEYSGSVHSYLRHLDNCFIHEQRDTLDILGSDGSARFGYLLLAASFARRDDSRTSAAHRGGSVEPPAHPQPDAAAEIQKICRAFEIEGVRTLAKIAAPFPVHASILTRWDELALRVMLHGAVSRPRSGDGNGQRSEQPDAAATKKRV